MKILNEIKRTLRVPLRIHWSAIVLPLLFIWQLGIYQGLLGFAIILISLLFHEYAHIWMALRQNVRVSHAILLAVGAAAMLDPNDLIGQHKKEFKIALAGPLASLLLALLLFTVIGISIAVFNATTVGWGLAFGFVMNVAFALFNILPLYPMDGGRVLNAILSMCLGGVRGVKISAMVCYVLGTIGVALALYTHNWWIGFILLIVMLFAKMQKDQVLEGLARI